MGTRYRRILRYLGLAHRAVDKETSHDQIKDLAHQSQGVLIATPTHTHARMIELCLSAGKPILCEKPLSTDVRTALNIIEKTESAKVPLRMMMQYDCLVDRNSSGQSHYDYFKHGADGLAWDCLQVIGLSKFAPYLNDVSPIWKCAINGRTLNIQDMDQAYITYIQKWMRYPQEDLGFLREIHEKTANFERTYRK